MSRPTLKESTRGNLASRSFLSRALVVAQVSISLLLLVGAIQFVRTLINLQRVGPRVHTQNLLLFNLSPGLIGYKDEKLVRLYSDISQRVEAIPGVTGELHSRELRCFRNR
jgi:hypothetical protein